MAVEANGRFLIDSAMKSVEWERAKGDLRALVAIQGSYSTGVPEREVEPRWETLRDRVEAFIKEIEDDGLAE